MCLPDLEPGTRSTILSARVRTVFVTNHVLSGVLIGQVLRRRPMTAFAVGVGSHLLLDAFPHWSCGSETPEDAERFLKAAQRDGLLGLGAMAVAALSVGRESRAATVAAMAGAVLLDLDKPILHFTGLRAFPDFVNRIHKAVQNETPNGLRNELVYGAAFATLGATLVGGPRRLPSVDRQA